MRSLMLSASSGAVSSGSMRLLLVLEMMFMPTMMTVSAACDSSQGEFSRTKQRGS